MGGVPTINTGGPSNGSRSTLSKSNCSRISTCPRSSWSPHPASRSPDEHPVAPARPNAAAIVAWKNFIDDLYKYERVLSLECEAKPCESLENQLDSMSTGRSS